MPIGSGSAETSRGVPGGQSLVPLLENSAATGRGWAVTQVHRRGGEADHAAVRHDPPGAARNLESEPHQALMPAREGVS